MLVLLVVVAAVMAIFAARTLGFLGTCSAVRIGYVGNGGWSSWSGNYRLLDGTMEKHVHPEEGHLHIAVGTEEGTISMEIKDTDGRVIFAENNMGTASFDVEASGEVVAQIVADHHKGSFSITSEHSPANGFVETGRESVRSPATPGKG